MFPRAKKNEGRDEREKLDVSLKGKCVNECSSALFDKNERGKKSWSKCHTMLPLDMLI